MRVSCCALQLLACFSLCTSTTTSTSTASLGQHVPHNTSLIQQLRRQLMANNYDYMPSSSEEPLITPPSSPPFQQKALDLDLDLQTPASPVSTAGLSNTPVDTTRPELDPVYNDNKKEYDNLDIQNNLNTVNKKEYNDVDRYYTDLNMKREDIEHEYNRQEFKNKLDRDYDIVEKEHEKLNVLQYEGDLPNREYDTDYLHDNDKTYIQTDKYNRSHHDDDDDDDEDIRHVSDTETDNDLNYENRKNKHRTQKLNKNIKEEFKKHHNDDDNVKNGSIYNNLASNTRDVDVIRPVGYVQRAANDDRLVNVNISTTPVTPSTRTELEERMGFVPRAHNDNDDDDDDSRDNYSGISKKHGVNKNDLLYYMTDERLKQAEENYLDLSNANDDDGSSSGRRRSRSKSSGGSSDGSSDDDYYDQTTTTANVKFNVFTAVSEGGGRRAGSGPGGGGGGGGTARKFVREQRPGEVVVLRLDDKPFPQFRLPAARRQYMHGSHSQQNIQ